MKNTAKLSGGQPRLRLERAKVKLLASYYGHPARDLRLICITGTTGKVAVAHFVHEILRTASQPAAILASEGKIKASVLHKFLNDAWKAKVTYAIITAPAESLEKEIFYGLPIYAAAITDFLPGNITTDESKAYLDAKAKLFQQSPEVVVLNRDDTSYPELSSYRGKVETLTYGASSDSDMRIDFSKLYRKGAEASLSFGNKNFTVASFLTGEPVIAYMACAATIATALNIAPAVIAEGIANYEPKESN